MIEARLGGAWRRLFVVCFTGLFLALSPGRAGAVELSIAPVNPEFIDHMQAKTVSLMQGLSANGHALSYLPSPVKRPSQPSRTRLAATDSLPSSFDLRTLGGVTPVQDQGSCGSCWAFATYGSMESYLKYRKGSHRTWDFSEVDMTQYHGFDLRQCAGGNYDMATAYLARWAGPVNSGDAPYPYAKSLLADASGAKVRRHVQNVWYLPERTGYLDNAQVKTALMTYGAVVVAIYYSDSYCDQNTFAYYFNGPAATSLNHGVVIVGWDDNYPRTSFLTGRRPPGDGAFIVKNSWGTGWGKEGYFHISYYDKKLSHMISFYSAESPGNFQHAYQYDPLGWTSSVGYSSETAWFANVFTAEDGAANIKAVSFHTPVAPSFYRVFIYKDVVGADPRNGVLVATKSGTLTKAGYRTIWTYKSREEEPPGVASGSKFSVVVKLTTPGYTFPIPVEHSVSGYSSNADASEGQSYVSPNGKTWDDLTLISSFERTNVCLKAFGG